MSATDEPQTCGAVDEPAYSVWFECELPPGHAGEHEATHYWTNEPHGPTRPPKPATGYVWLGDAYAQMAAQQMELVLRASPLIRRDKVMRVEPRVGLFAPVKLDPAALADLAADAGFEDIAAKHPLG